MEDMYFQPKVLELLESINERLGILIAHSTVQAALSKGKSAFQTSDMTSPPEPPNGSKELKDAVSRITLPEVSKPNGEDKHMINKLVDPLDAEIRLHMSHDEPIG